MKFSLILLLLLSFPGWAKWTLTTYNIRNFDNDYQAGRTDLKELGKILKDVKSDVMVFEEIGNLKAFDDLVKRELKGYLYEASQCGGTGRQHLVVAYNPKVFQFVSKKEDLSFTGNASKCGSLRPLLLVGLKYKKSSEVYTFGAVHLKAGSNERAFNQRWGQYKKLTDLAVKYKKDNLILLGDFNTTGYIIKDEDYSKFESFLNQADMRSMNDNVGCTNYWPGTLGGKEFQPSILDHIVVQDKFVKNVGSSRVGSHCEAIQCRPATPEDLGRSYLSVSDHCPVQVTFNN